jgi:glycosyltransferase involved in cell wall biosynthesis
MQNKLKVFTWHIHGSYLFYLSQGNYDIYIPTKPEKTEGYYGRGETFPFGDNVIEIPADDVKNHEFDCIIFQTNNNYLVDQYEILSPEQRELPRIYIEHDPPRQHPTDTKHIVNDENVVLVHVTHFNRLMWDSNNTPTRVIEHGVTDPGIRYQGDLDKGIVVINNLPTRGRLLGHDIFMHARTQVPLDLEFQSHYRFFFNPIRYTSLGLAICEAMMMGIPVVGLATTELSAVIENGVSGFIHTDVEYLIDKMKLLINEPELAKQIGAKGREVAIKRFNIQRFANDWEQLINEVISANNKNLISA